MTEYGGEVIVYQDDDGGALVQLRSVRGTVWLSQAQLAELYDTSVPKIAQIIKRVLSEHLVRGLALQVDQHADLVGAGL